MNIPLNRIYYESEVVPVLQRLYEKHGADAQLTETILNIFEPLVYQQSVSLDQRIQQAQTPHDFQSLAFSMLLKGETAKAEEYLRRVLDTINSAGGASALAQFIRSGMVTTDMITIEGEEFNIPIGSGVIPKSGVTTEYERERIHNIEFLLNNLGGVQRIITDSKIDFYTLIAKKGLKSWEELGRLF